MAGKIVGRAGFLLIAGLVCMMLVITFAAAAGPATPGTLGGKSEPGQHPEKVIRVPETTQTLVTPTSTMTPVAAQATESSSAFSNPSIIAAAIGLLSAGIGAGVTLYTHVKKK